MPEKEPQKQATDTTEGAQNISSTTNEMLDLALVQSLGLTMQNAVTAQQNAQTLNAAIVSATVARILSTKKKHTSEQTAPVATKQSSAADRKK